ncbi:pyruvate kinase 1, cytosolic-like [Arachis duranensis]|uniref:Pyruvate kinase 1, cytosolic-like n=1 Tax=Arachis duranensis TaxID=130453 RepID=A0A9C6TCF3_ARADU|nr:pyruvate kinase 1, cytosolic-like [Arachis duranensis]
MHRRKHEQSTLTSAAKRKLGSLEPLHPWTDSDVDQFIAVDPVHGPAVRAAIKVKASVIICFTSSGRAARLIAKYRPTMPVLSVVIPRLKTNQLKWSFSGAFEAESTSATNEWILKVALDHGKAMGIIKSHDRVVVCQKLGDASVVKIIEFED